jgi:hypothetical protein
MPRPADGTANGSTKNTSPAAVGWEGASTRRRQGSRQSRRKQMQARAAALERDVRRLLADEVGGLRPGNRCKVLFNAQCLKNCMR